LWYARGIPWRRKGERRLRDPEISLFRQGYLNRADRNVVALGKLCADLLHREIFNFKERFGQLDFGLLGHAWTGLRRVVRGGVFRGGGLRLRRLRGKGPDRQEE
jgi:hypothetical protein